MSSSPFFPSSASVPAWVKAGWWVLLAILLLRLLLMLWLPLTDTTEARYAEIARKMLETGNWVTPLHDYGVPFWAKPPLSTWLSALSMGLFGVNEFAVRLPAFLLSLGTLALVAGLARPRVGSEAAFAAVLMLASSVLFFVAAGSVMTDPALLFSTCLIMVAFWRAMHESGRVWPYAFFVGVGLGLLAKGPIALVLTGLPIFLWVLWGQQWLALWQRLPWVKGALLALLIAAPWYLWAELRTPGFLEYFIVGEHIQRFLDSGWGGDKYGFAHATVRGVIWLYAIAALLPWSLLIGVWWWQARKTTQAPSTSEAGWQGYLWLWACVPLLFFSFSRNIIFPYVLPMMPAACLLFMSLWQRLSGRSWSYLPGFASFTVALGVLLLVLLATQSERLLRTQKQVIEQWQLLSPATDSQLVYWNGRREFSAEFYSGGRAKTTEEPEQLELWLQAPTDDFLVIEEKYLARLPANIRNTLEPLAQVEVKGDQILILGEKRHEQGATSAVETP